jgi:hypothetical protein
VLRGRPSARQTELVTAIDSKTVKVFMVDAQECNGRLIQALAAGRGHAMRVITFAASP